jgi:hypothetical protein
MNSASGLGDAMGSAMMQSWAMEYTIEEIGDQCKVVFAC